MQRFRGLEVVLAFPEFADAPEASLIQPPSLACLTIEHTSELKTDVSIGQFTVPLRDDLTGWVT